jgi:hypothetical protein
MKLIKHILTSLILLFAVSPAVAQLPSTPAGVVNSNYTWAAWLTPESFNTSNGTWQNLITTDGTAGHFTRQNAGANYIATSEPPTLVNNGYNFHPAVRFSNPVLTLAAQRLVSNNVFRFAAGENITVIFVLKDRNHKTWQYVMSLDNAATSRDIVFNDDELISFWSTTRRNLGTDKTNGLISVSMSNDGLATSNFGGIVTHINGRREWHNIGTGAGAQTETQSLAATAARITLAAGTVESYYGLDAILQEVIVLKANGSNNHLNAEDLRKINFYLAIKYGITLNHTDNYITSKSVTVWNRTLNTGYNHIIFGLGRDDASGIYQKQAQSAEKPILTIFAGNTLTPLNIDNPAPNFPDGHFLMLGSNNADREQDYIYPAGQAFANVNAITKLNYRSNLVYKVQATGDWLAHPVSLKLNVDFPASYVLVSSGADFDPVKTAIYELSADKTLLNVPINNGDYISFAGFMPSPGGLSKNTYALDLWIDGNNSTNTSWQNLSSARHQLEQFSTHAPTVRNSRFNYNRELFFGNQTSSKLWTKEPYNLALNHSYYIFVVSEQISATTDATLFTFNNSSVIASLNWRLQDANILTGWWTTTERQAGFRIADGRQRFGIKMLNVNNSHSSTGNQIWLNGVTIAGNTFNLGTALNAAGAAQYNTNLLIGNASNSTGTGSTVPFNGTMQEMIILTRPVGQLMPLADIQKVNTYLAIKYGMTLNQGSNNANDNYVASNGEIVWQRTGHNSGYNHQIFGLARDDQSGLRQMQSQSIDNNQITLFRGSTITSLNSDNNGTFDTDITYLMLGSNHLDIRQNIRYNYNLTGNNAGRVNFRTALVYRAQVTNAGVSGGQQFANMRINSSRVMFVLVSNDANFPDGNRRAYPVVNGIATNIRIDNGDFVSFAGFEAMPGGVFVTTGTVSGAGNYSLDLWVDGNHSTATVWNNLIYANHTLTRQGTSPAPLVQNSRFNYHRDLYFGNATNTKLRTTNNYTITNAADNAYYAFVVSEHNETGEAILVSYNPITAAADARRASLRWDNATTVRFNWGGLNDDVNRVQNVPNFGIASLNVLNTESTSSNSRIFFNGTSSANTRIRARFGSNVPLLIGNGNNVDGNTLGFNGTIQEIILMRGSDLMNATDIHKIHSYLAVKYGITLSTNYVDSENAVVWNRSRFTNYNAHVFGLGRDDASGLYQKQTKGANDTTELTMFIGSGRTTLNSQNNGTLDERKFVMLGSNALRGNRHHVYSQSLGAFENQSNSLTEIVINYRTAQIYAVQITQQGHQTANNSHIVSFRVNDRRHSHILVSGDADFIPAQTRIYPIEAHVVTHVEINDGDFITLVGFEPSPGGLDVSDNGTLLLDLWVDGNNSTNTSWENLARSNFELERFSTHAPIIRDSRFNFNREIFFGNAASAKLRSSANYNLTPGHGYYVFVVSEQPAATSSRATLITFNSASANTFQWHTSASAGRNNLLLTEWTSTLHLPGFSETNFNRHGIATLNVVNNNNSSNNAIWLNGTRGTPFNLLATTAGGATTNSSRFLVGNASTSATTGNDEGFSGAIQEIIILRRSGTTTNAAPLMSNAELQRIHSYLAIKYGLTLVPGSNLADNNYVNSSGEVVWSRTANAGYNNRIFGIAHDRNNGLKQSQARSAEARYLTVYLGNRLETLNSQNFTLLENGQYLMIGSDGTAPVKQLYPTISNHTVYENGETFATVMTTDINIHSCVYKAQLTAMDTIGIHVIGPTDFSHVLVSTHPDFLPSRTRLYAELRDVMNIGLTPQYCYFKFVGTAPGPGGIADGLVLWLRADDDVSLNVRAMTSENLQSTTSVSADDPLSGYGHVQGGLTEDSDIATVHSWSDMARGHTYVHTLEGRRRIPTYAPYVPEMNFKPSVRFWGSGNSFSSYLVNDQTNPMGEGVCIPANGHHTAYFLVNNDFSSNAWIYTLSFSNVTDGITFQGSPDVAYGVERSSNILGGRFRTYGTATACASGEGGGGPVQSRDRNLFNIGATSLLGFQTDTRGGTNNRPLFRFTGKEEPSVGTFGWGRGFGNASVLGSGYSHDRTIRGYMAEAVMFDRVLNTQELDQLESYFALKYGLTLRPERYASGRLDYKLSDGRIIWAGNTGTNPNDVLFYNNIASALRDDLARLHNKHSHSTDAGSIMYIGKAGTKLCNCGLFADPFDDDLTAVIWGSTDMDHEQARFGTPFIDVTDDLKCGDFTKKFSRVWRVKKYMPEGKEGQPLQMLFSARTENARLVFASETDAYTTQYYNHLNTNWNYVLLVAKTYEDMIAGNYSAVAPMTWIENKHQVNMAMTEDEMFITFGLKENATGCAIAGAQLFTGSKTHDWTAWTSRLNTRTEPNATAPLEIALPNNATVGNGSLDLLDNVHLLDARVIYQAGTYSPSGTGVSTPSGFPRSVNSPTNGTLEVRRRGGQPGNVQSDVIIRMRYNTPITPQFSISGLDGTSQSREEVTIVGRCNLSGTMTDFTPILTYAGNARNATYTISGGSAKVNKTVTANATNVNGRVNVEFEDGVTEIEIRYKTDHVRKNRSTTTQSIYISPINVRFTSLPPPINEDGLAFSKRVMEPYVTTCDPVQYAFYIQNTNCEGKYVDFMDNLPEGMTWVEGSIGLDEINSNNNKLAFNDYAGNTTLALDNVYVAGTSTLRISALAEFKDDAEGGEYSNRAHIYYDRIANNETIRVEQPSVDRQTLDPLTSFYAEYEPRQQQVGLEVRTSRAFYRPQDTIEVITTVNNPNRIIPDSWFDIDFTENFSLVTGSFTAETKEGEDITNQFKVILPEDDDDDKSFFLVGGVCYDNPNITPECPENAPEGFNIPMGEIIIRFKLAVPELDLIEDEIDDYGALTGTKVPLEIHYNLFTSTDDHCLAAALRGLQSVRTVPLFTLTHIVTNRHVSARLTRTVDEDELLRKAGCQAGVPVFGSNIGTITWGGNLNIETQIWEIEGNGIKQVWSNAVQASVCANRGDDFDQGTYPYVISDCQRPANGFNGDYFTWCVVGRFQNQLCPPPWRVPTVQDYADLDIALGGNGSSRTASDNPLPVTINDQYAWYVGPALPSPHSHTNNATNHGGIWGGARWTEIARGSKIVQGAVGASIYWTMTENPITAVNALVFAVGSGMSGIQIGGTSTPKGRGVGVRCVREVQE